MVDNINGFLAWCKAYGITPTEYDNESLSYYQCLCKLTEKVSECITQVNENEEGYEQLQKNFTELKSFVDNYFDNLDVQDEIDKKLDEMYNSGLFDEIFSNHYTPTQYKTGYYSDYIISDDPSQNILNAIAKGVKILNLNREIHLTSNLIVDTDDFTIENGTIYNAGNTIKFLNTATNSNPIYDITNISGRTITVNINTVLQRGDTCIIGKLSDFDFLYVTITSVSDETITIDSPLPFTPKTTTIQKINNTNINIKNINFILNGTTGITLGYTLNGGSISNCSFTTDTQLANALSITGNDFKIKDNTFTTLNTALSLYATSNCNCYNNTFDFCSISIRCVASIYNNIHSNNITNGATLATQAYGVGIEITSYSQSNVSRNCFNNIIGNNITGCNIGRAGSGIGGIHLNFYSSNNRILDNSIRGCTFGIYLENAGNNNNISNNSCCYSTGYYGVGIEIDLFGKNNIISNNVCDYNVGSTTASESCGIYVRGNTCQYNVISSNSCSSNGKAGIISSGYGTIITNNICSENGSSDFSNSADIIVQYSANKINNNTLSNTTYPNLIVGTDASSARVNFTLISSNHFNSSVSLFHLNYLSFINNILSTKPSLSITKPSGSSEYNLNVLINSNMFINTSPEFNIDSVSGYDFSHNIKENSVLAITGTNLQNKFVFN